MSPASLTSEKQLDLQLQPFVRAFEALLLTTQQLSCRERSLQQRLEYAHDEYIKLADRLQGGPDTNTKAISEKIHGLASEFESYQKPSFNPPDVVKALAESGIVGDQTIKAIAEGVVYYKSILGSGRDFDLNSCLVATRAGVGLLEKDFTTKGTQGSLRCPFAKPNKKPPVNGGVVDRVEDALKFQNGDMCGHEDLDPIKAELNDRRSSQAPSVRTSTTRCPVSRCPIRYLNQHSPEEVADYVERHKHEIPRSHAICVQRYQKDSQSMRQLDAKYGSLINMIRGLSVKHQAFLPDRGNNGAATSSSSVERVEKWAEEVGLTSEEVQPCTKEDEEGDGERKGRFDRPLREVRVGESPSRPWGIPVPAPPPVDCPPSPPVALPVTASPNETKPTPGADNIPPVHGPTLQPHDKGSKVGRCPFGHGAPAGLVSERETETVRDQERKNDPLETAEKDDRTRQDLKSHHHPDNQTASVVFNGPVFFGFSPEQTASFLQQLGSIINKDEHT
ncbi:hypothetical protein BDV25DRAFT_134002 [Aspergillus avenaceus]|uniref:Uncharacterized protein n=1 Tax=Aspergillus avenaceus TaxID=36643 RepID=A0A5N6TFV7_ASPAV|nr:hypothetical protein BDV25DRAFT_134002 [Aspergillus avenaceus]